MWLKKKSLRYWARDGSHAEELVQTEERDYKVVVEMA